MIRALAGVLATLAAVGAAYWLGGRRSARRAARELDGVRGELARRLNELFTLQELAYLLSESLQLDRIVSQVARYVTRFLEAEGSLVALTNEHGPPIRIAGAEGSLQKAAGRHLSEAEAGLIGTVIGRERLEVVEAAPGLPPPMIVGIPVQRAAVAPLRAHSVTVGALVVVDRAGGPFRAEDLRLLSTVATHAAIVLANARFFDLIRAGKEQWETTFDALAEGIAVVDEAGRVRRANRALAGLLGKPLPAVIGLDLTAELAGASSELPSLLASARRGDPLTAVTLESPRLNQILRVTAAPIRGSEPAGWVVALVEDVTDQKALETQLIQNEKLAAVGQMVSGVAHELNNPLTSIAGLAEFLMEHAAAGDKDREHLRVIQEQAERAGRIVRNLLTFARRGSGEYGDVDLNDIAQRTSSLIGYELRLREVEFETHLAPDLPTVMGDRSQLQQVVLNLLTNAVQAVADNPPERPRRIRLTTAKAGDQVVLKVADTGSGIAPEHLANMFTPFFTTKEPGHGTGLGLSISFGIVERYGGKLYVERSTEGAVFVMSLPPGERAARRSAPALEPLNAPTPPLGSVRTPHVILLVDEDPAVQRMIRALFSEDGQRVETPPSAGEAVRRLETGAFDLIIADARTAVSAGETFADVLLTRWPDLRSRTILVTADVRAETDAWLKRLGCSYFQKPFRINDLKAAAARILANQRK